VKIEDYTLHKLRKAHFRIKQYNASDFELQCCIKASLLHTRGHLGVHPLHIFIKVGMVLVTVAATEFGHQQHKVSYKCLHLHPLSGNSTAGQCTQ
jgi:hypothetical protein